MFSCTITVDVNKEEATLRVVNNSSFNVWVKIDNGSEVQLNPNQIAEQSWELVSGETKNVNIEYGIGLSFLHKS